MSKNDTLIVCRECDGCPTLNRIGTISVDCLCVGGCVTLLIIDDENLLISTSWQVDGGSPGDFDRDNAVRSRDRNGGGGRLTGCELLERRTLSAVRQVL